MSRGAPSPLPSPPEGPGGGEGEHAIEGFQTDWRSRSPLVPRPKTFDFRQSTPDTVLVRMFVAGASEGKDASYLCRLRPSAEALRRGRAYIRAMALRSMATATISFGLVSIPVRLYPATQVSAGPPTFVLFGGR